MEKKIKPEEGGSNHKFKSKDYKKIKYKYRKDKNGMPMTHSGAIMHLAKKYGLSYQFHKHMNRQFWTSLGERLSDKNNRHNYRLCGIGMFKKGMWSHKMKSLKARRKRYQQDMLYKFPERIIPNVPEYYKKHVDGTPERIYNELLKKGIKKKKLK